VLGHLLPGLELAIYDRHPDRAAALVALAEATDGVAGARACGSAREATETGDVVVTVASFAPADERQTLTGDWLAPDSLVVAVDYATYVSAAVARDAAQFLVDEREQFLANRDAGSFDGYPDPTATIGEAIRDGTGRPPRGHVLVTHLGVGLADLVFGDAILRRAEADGLGMVLTS
jgi:ornithine cyclodeaminase/alanine dehydrogenase-like protein (mu-crystallin family)